MATGPIWWLIHPARTAGLSAQRSKDSEIGRATRYVPILASEAWMS
ncbi:hypothetical protein [Celeribacter baekdonensis]|nr:hypothetical protein [Celeribacter baekdonensis]